MAKKQAAVVVPTFLSVGVSVIPGITETLAGTVVALDNGAFQVDYRRPRTSKIDRAIIPAKRVVSAYFDGNGLGAVTYRSVSQVAQLDEVSADSLSFDTGLLAVTSAAGTYSYCTDPDLSILTASDVEGGGDEEKPAAPAEEKPAAPAAKGAKGGKAAKGF